MDKVWLVYTVGDGSEDYSTEYCWIVRANNKDDALSKVRSVNKWLRNKPLDADEREII